MARALKTGLIYDPLYERHDPGPGHPECPARCDAVLRGIREAVPEERLLMLPPRPATEEEICLCHTADYLELVREDVASGMGTLRTGDTGISRESLEAALLAAGGALAATDAVMEGKVRNAFCAVRPPGHHATADRGMGFCIFNNAAIAARYAQNRHGVERVLIADWDVHHGNGTQEIFYRDPSVFYFSTHQWPCYPGTGRALETGADAGKGYTINCPFASGSGAREILGAFRERLVPAMKEFKPGFVVVSAGFDGMDGDLLGGFRLTAADFSELTGILMEVAEEYAGGRLVSVLEGGYYLPGLAETAGAHVRRLAD